MFNIRNLHEATRRIRVAFAGDVAFRVTPVGGHASRRDRVSGWAGVNDFGSVIVVAVVVVGDGIRRSAAGRDRLGAGQSRFGPGAVGLTSNCLKVIAFIAYQRVRRSCNKVIY